MGNFNFSKLQGMIGSRRLQPAQDGVNALIFRPFQVHDDLLVVCFIN